MDPIERTSPDSTSVIAALRQSIIGGRFPAGARLAEIPVAEALGVSRTPVRLAFRTLAQEGLLAPAGKRGYVVRAFSEADVRCAVEVRGALEGLAARRLAERGLATAQRDELRRCLAEGEAVLAKGHLVEDDIGRWSRLNQAFHACIVGGTDSQVIADAIARNNHLPFASADSIAIDKQALDKEYQKLRLAQMQHQLVVEALEQRESARVEMLMREHAYIGLRYGALFGLEAPRGSAGGLPA
jgi:GntR family transcriptional regulator of vanillate catabolism